VHVSKFRKWLEKKSQALFNVDFSVSTSRVSNNYVRLEALTW
jgi:hypothetical protein